MKNKSGIIAFVIIVAVVGFIVFNIVRLNRVEDEGGIPRGSLPVHWAYPDVQTIVSRVNARGNVELRDRTIVFPSTQAQILTVHVSAGDVVSVGDLLITYDDSILETLEDQLAQARLALRSAELGLAATRIGPANTEILAAETQIEQARASIANVQAQLDQIDLQISQAEDNITTARNSLDNTLFLYENGIVARVELDNATEAVRRLEDQRAIIQSQREAAALGLPTAQESERLAVAQLDAVLNRNRQPAVQNQAQLQQIAIDQAQLNISQIERNIAYFERNEHAAVNGTVLNVLVAAGEVSISGRPLLEIADVSNENLVIVVHVPENDSGGIDIGQDVEISSSAIGTHRYAGTIETIHPLAAPRQMGNTIETVVTVEITVDEATRLRAGNTVDADIITNISEDTLVVPLMSTISVGGEAFVFVVTDDSTLERVDVTLGEFSAMYIEAIGVSSASRVVNNPTHTMYDGMFVRPIQPIN